METLVKRIQLLLNISVTGNLDEITLAAIKNKILSDPTSGLLKTKIYNLSGVDAEYFLGEVYDWLLTRVSHERSIPENKIVLELKKELEEVPMAPKQEEISRNLDTSGEQFVGNIAGKATEHLLSPGEYMDSIAAEKEYIFLHHTAGWEDPFKQIDIWNNDNIGRVGTHYVIGGSNIKNLPSENNGKIVRAIPMDNWAYHLGGPSTGIDQYMEKHSIGIELCNFGKLTGDGKTWAGQSVHEDQIYTLAENFRGYRKWHQYSDKQIASLRSLIIALANKYSIDVRGEGLIKWIRAGKISDAFEYKEPAANGEVKGLLSHTNVRRDKTDISPQSNLIEMLLSI